MPLPSIIDPTRSVGGVLGMPFVPPGPVAVYNRSSSDSLTQYGRCGEKLKARTYAAYWEIRKDRRVKRLCRGIEKGYMAVDRPCLEEAAEYVRKKKLAALVAPFLSRFIRAADYHPAENPSAKPSDEEFAILHERTGGITLATFYPPGLSDSHERGIAVKLGGGGRPRKTTDRQLSRILRLRSNPETRAVRKIAEKLKMPRSTVEDALKRYVPGTWEGTRWKDLDDPYEEWENQQLNPATD